MKIFELPVTEALARLHSTPLGLTHAEAARRGREFGANEVARVAREPWALRFARNFTHFFAIILWIAAALAFYAESRAPGQGMLTLGFAILGVILINGLFSFWQAYRAEQALAALQRLLPHTVRVLRAGATEAVAATALVPGDIVFLKGGDDVPADCRLIEAFGVRVNTATITGEALPKARTAVPVAATGVMQAKNILLAGTTLVAGEARALVYATGMHTEFGRIAHLTQATTKGASPLQREIARLSRWVAVLSLALGVVFFVLGQQLGLTFWVSLIFAIGIIVANVPEGLLPTLTLALAMGAQRMARRQALIRHLPSVETLGSTTVICTDKTGTLTQNRLRVHSVSVDGVIHDVAAQAFAITTEAARRFCEIAWHCHALEADNNTTVTTGESAIRPTQMTGRTGEASRASASTCGPRLGPIGDPLEDALIDFAQPHLGAQPPCPRVDELAFDSERRRMSTLHESPAGQVLYTKGAFEALLPLCRAVHWQGQVLSLDETLRQRLIEQEADFAARGLRVLALAYRQVPAGTEAANLEQDLILAGLAVFEDPPRPEVPEAIAQCRSAGIRVIMVTGDHPRTAAAIAREIGLSSNDSPRVITGEQLDRLSDPELQLALGYPEVLFARIAADQKRRIVASLKRKGEIVAVTGDGVNDAPALKEAHIGIAMGLSGSDVAKAAADMVLLDDNFASIVAAIEEGRAVFDNIRKFLTYILTSNIPEVVPYLAFVLFKIPLPLTIIQILAVDLGTDMLPALALGAEKPDPSVMQRPPRRPDQRLVDGALITRAYLWLGVLEAGAAMAAFFFVLHQGGWRYGVTLASHDPLYLQATSACLGAIIVMQIANVWLCRSPTASLWSRPFTSNPLILWGIAAEIVLISGIVYTPWGNTLFGTAPLAAEVWLTCVLFAAAMLLLEEGRKRLTHHR